MQVVTIVGDARRLVAKMQPVDAALRQDRGGFAEHRHSDGRSGKSATPEGPGEVGRRPFGFEGGREAGKAVLDAGEAGHAFEYSPAIGGQHRGCVAQVELVDVVLRNRRRDPVDIGTGGHVSVSLGSGAMRRRGFCY